MNKVKIIFCTVILLGVALWYLQWSNRPSIQTDTLNVKLKEARQQAANAVMIRSVSKQMEEIAYQQKELSDCQRMRAERQAQDNYKMKLKVEQEWKHALFSQREAERAYRMAEEQRQLAEEQREKANEQRRKAENAKRKADTLAYLTLGRSLSSIAMTQYHTGNGVVASLLAYSAWLFIKRYGGDTYQSSVFNALSLISGQPVSWHCHKAGISSIIWDKTDKHCFYTCGHYGEVLKWEEKNGRLNTKVLYANSNEDFRSLYFGSGNILYALTYSGKLMTFGKIPQIYDTGEKGCVRLFSSGADIWLLTHTGQLCNAKGTETPNLHRTTCITTNKTNIYIGCENGDMLQADTAIKCFRTLGNIRHTAITAIATDTATGRIAWGYEDGTIILTGRDGRHIKTLVGHQSTVTGLVFQNEKLYSCSRDHTLRLWNLHDQRTEPVTAVQAKGWLLCLSLSPDQKNLFIGDSNGNLYRLSVSPDDMATSIRNRLPRNFTRQEWKQYIGNGVPYEILIDKKHDT